MIQDIIFMLGGLVLLATLFPMFSKSFPGAPWLSSIPIAVIMFIFCINAASLGLVLAAISYGLTCLGWVFIACFRRLRKQT